MDKELLGVPMNGEKPPLVDHTHLDLPHGHFSLIWKKWKNTLSKFNSFSIFKFQKTIKFSNYFNTFYIFVIWNT